jgi:hypothetical protein
VVAAETAPGQARCNHYTKSRYEIKKIRKEVKGKELMELIDFRAWECYNACVGGHARRVMMCAEAARKDLRRTKSPRSKLWDR